MITARRLNLALNNIDYAYLISMRNQRISDNELCLLYVLDDGKPHSQKEIAQQWLIPKQTINTITKRWERAGYLLLTPVSGKRREMQITLTAAGKEYARGILAFIYKAEAQALQKTIACFSESFIDALEFFGQSLKEAFQDEEQHSAE